MEKIETLIDSFPDWESADRLRHQLAASLVRLRTVERHGIKVARIGGWWGVFLVARHPDRPSPK